MINSAHVFHCGHLSLSSNVVSLDPQQHCSWLYHNALRQMPSFRSVIQSAAMSINPANAPDANPVSVTTSHPDHASYKLFVISHADSFFLLLIRLCLSLSLHFSRTQSIVWKSSYVPTPGIGSSKRSSKCVELLMLPPFVIV